MARLAEYLAKFVGLKTVEIDRIGPTAPPESGVFNLVRFHQIGT